MSLIMAQSTDDSESVHDRYSVIQTIHVDGEDDGDEESRDNSASLHHKSTAASVSSSDSRTCGTSIGTDGSETLERDEFFGDDEYGDLDALSYESQPMVVDGWVDSLCGCLDHPMAIYQSMCLGRETSLLRQSKGRTRSTINQRAVVSFNNRLTSSAAKRRNLRLQDKSVRTNGEKSDIESTMEDAKNNKIKIMRIQPKEDFEVKEFDGFEKKRNTVLSTHKKVGQAPVIADAEKTDNTGSPEPTAINLTRPEESQEKEPKIAATFEPTDIYLEKYPILESSTSDRLLESALQENNEELIDKETNAEPEVLGDLNIATKSMVERAIQKSAKENEEREIHPQLSNTFKGVDVKTDPPIEPKIVATLEVQPIHIYSVKHPKLEASTSDRPVESVSQEDNKDLKNTESASDRGEHTSSPVRETEVAMRRSDSVPRKQETEVADLTDVVTPSPSLNDDTSRTYSEDNEQKIDDDKSLASSIEIIDVLSMDDQDSWIPGSRNDVEHSIIKNGHDLHQDIENPPRSNDHSTPNHMLSSKNTHKQDTISVNIERLVSVDSTVDELWIEEEAKLNNKPASNGETSSRPKRLTTVESAEELWNEESLKLQDTPDDIFDDPKAREAFLGHRRGRLRDTGMDSRNILRSRLRHQKLQKPLKEGRGDSDSSERSKRLSRSKSLGRNPPSPEFRPSPVIKQSRSKSRERSLVNNKPIPFQQGSNELLNVIKQSRSKSRERSLVNNKPIPFQQGSNEPFIASSPPSRKKDLIAVRSIEEGQRMRSSKRDPIKYNADLTQKSSRDHPIDVHSYVVESSSRGPYDERSSQSRTRRTPERRIKSSSRQRSKSLYPRGTGLTNIEGSENNQHTNDERDDQESLHTINHSESRPINSQPAVEKNWSDYDTAVSATKELRKLEKKIERQLRQVKRETKTHEDVDSQTVQSIEIRRMEKKLSKKLKSVTSDDLDSQTVSSREIRRLEKQLSQKLSGENENRASKLKRIKRKGVSSPRALESSSGNFKDQRQIQHVSSPQPEQTDLEASPEFVTSPSPSSKNFLQRSQENRHEGSKSENSRSLRSRYVRRSTTSRVGRGQRGYSKVPETD